MLFFFLQHQTQGTKGGFVISQLGHGKISSFAAAVLRLLAATIFVGRGGKKVKEFRQFSHKRRTVLAWDMETRKKGISICSAELYDLILWVAIHWTVKVFIHGKHARLSILRCSTRVFHGPWHSSILSDTNEILENGANFDLESKE